MGVSLLNGMSTQLLAELERACKWKWYGGNEQIIDQHSTSYDVFFVVEGKVRVVNYSILGREITLEDIEMGSHFGELSAIDKKPRSASVIALIPTLLAIMPSKIFLRLLAGYPEISLRQIQNMARVIRASTTRIIELSTLAAKNRIQAELLRLAQISITSENCAEISPIPIHGDIASRVSTTRETVARVLGQLVHKGIVERRKDVLLIHDIKKLRQLVGQIIKE